LTAVAWLNGDFVSAAEARINIFDGGFLHGAGLFETMRAEHGCVFRIASHLRRLCASYEKILRPMTVDSLPSHAQFQELLNRNELETARVRLTVTAGSMKEADSNQGGALTICATAAPLAAYPQCLFDEGVHVIVCPFRQGVDDPLAGHKTTAYLSRLLGLREAAKVPCMEAVWFTTRNELAEGSISNIFVVRNGVLRTPPLTTPVVPGIARSVVLESAAELGIETQESPLHIGDLLDAEECLLTNAIMQVMPVIRVERRDIGGGKVGNMAKKLLDAYRAKVRAECTRS